jgi:3',5'-cyclic AMP phosphodiesterase CpdA
MRVFAISDLHVDYAANRDWVLQLPLAEYHDDVLIVAGDISDSLAAIDECLAALTCRFSRVMYVPGNHELWVHRDHVSSSLAKFDAVMTTARDLGVEVRPWRNGSTVIVPLLGWYDFSFGEPDEALRAMWMDFHACVWPPDWNEAAITQHFTCANTPDDRRVVTDAATVITFSHFLPRIDVMPATIPSRFRNLYPVLGSSVLDQQLRGLGSNLHRPA